MLGNQRGGRLLGKGEYGCTFDPVPVCADGTRIERVGDLHAVGKVTVEDIEDELAIGREIMSLPLARQYFALPTQSCRTKTPVDDPGAASCKILDEAPQDLRTLIMPMGGREILAWSMNRVRLAENFEAVLKHLLEGAILYGARGIVHNDIHMGNILVDDHNVARLIDFGLAFHIDEVNSIEDANISRTFRPKVLWQAPEIQLWRMLYNRVPVAEGVRVMKQYHPQLTKLELQFPGRPLLVDSLKDLANTAPEFRQMDFGAYAKRYAKALDAWRIGLVMWVLWNDLMATSVYRFMSIWQRADVIRRVLGGLTEFDPRRRWSVTRALQELDPKTRMSD